jgi:hypothetical protein
MGKDRREQPFFVPAASSRLWRGQHAPPYLFFGGNTDICFIAASQSFLPLVNLSNIKLYASLVALLYSLAKVSASGLSPSPIEME